MCVLAALEATEERAKVLGIARVFGLLPRSPREAARGDRGATRGDRGATRERRGDDSIQIDAFIYIADIAFIAFAAHRFVASISWRVYLVTRPIYRRDAPKNI